MTKGTAITSHNSTHGHGEAISTGLNLIDLAPGIFGNQRCDDSGTESIVDIDHADIGGAGVEHGEERGQALEVGAVADRRGNGDHRAADNPPDYAWQSTFHTCANDNNISRFQQAATIEQPVH